MLFASTLTAVFAALASVGSATPVAPAEDVIISPPVTYPSRTTAWTTASSQTVRWDTSSIPEEYKNQTGMLLLGHWQSSSENLNITSPLANQFAIGDGQVDIVVPNVPTGLDYIVVLFGDSGNASPEFTILQVPDLTGLSQGL